MQKYDERGYPVNPHSEALKKRLRHSQNDVLTTVGICTKVDDARIMQLQEKLNPKKCALIESENAAGLCVDAASGIASSLVEICAVGLRHRLQVN